jgi:hypothetical protein
LCPPANVLDSSMAPRAGVSIDLLRQPPSTLVDCFPPLNRWEVELEGLGSPGLSAQASSLARMTAPELVKLYKDILSQSNVLRASIGHLSQELVMLGQQSAQVYQLLAFLRTFDLGRLDMVAPPVSLHEPLCGTRAEGAPPSDSLGSRTTHWATGPIHPPDSTPSVKPS